jgi:hypothetical protein
VLPDVGRIKSCVQNKMGQLSKGCVDKLLDAMAGAQFKVCKDQTYALCAAARCNVFDGAAYCQCDVNLSAAVRHVRARTETQYYQLAIVNALAQNVSLTIRDLQRVTSETATIGSDLVDAKQGRRRFEMARADDETRLNELLNRRPDEPLNVETSLDLAPLPRRVDELIRAPGDPVGRLARAKCGDCLNAG